RSSRTEQMPDMAAAKILVADDDQSLVRTLTWILKENGYEVSVAPGGEGLMGKLEEERPHLLLLDIMMPKVDGPQLLAKMKADEIYHILVRRVARVLQISKCSMVLAKAGDQLGVVVAAYENPMLRNLQIELARYPEIQRALTTGRAVLVEDVAADPLYAEERVRWERERITVPTRSAVALPFSMKDQQVGVFFLRTTGEDPPLTRADAQFAETVIRTAVAAIEKAYDFETAVSDKKRLEKLAATDALTGCLNRRALSEELGQELDRAGRHNLAVTILLADIDRFKLVNDTRGHIAGDSVLRQVGEIRCPKCGAVYPATPRFCPRDGNMLVEAQSKAPLATPSGGGATAVRTPPGPRRGPGLDRAATLSGQTLDARYQVTKKLGEGG